MVPSSRTAPVVTTTVLDTVVVNCSYRTALSSRYGYDSVSWSVASGELPPGLSIVNGREVVNKIPGTGAIVGIPTQTGTYTFAVRATDLQGRSDSRQVTLKVSPRPLNGVDFEYFESDTFHSVASMQGLQPDKVGVFDQIRYFVRDRVMGYAFRMHGWLRVTESGVHRFRNAADYECIMTVGDRTISNGGGSAGGWHEVIDTVTLKPGFYRFDYRWYNRTGGNQATGWQKPGSSSMGSFALEDLYLDSAGVVGTTQELSAPTATHHMPEQIRVFDLRGRRIGVSAANTARMFGAHVGSGVYVAESNARGFTTHVY